MIGVGFQWGFFDYNECEDWGDGFGLSYPLFDDDDSLKIVDLFEVVYLPHNVIIDHTMTVRYAEGGIFNETSVVETIEDLLSKLPTVGVEESGTGQPRELPATVHLHDAYPNPFNASTTISYTLPSDSRVRLDVFDVGGRHVRTLEDMERKGAGHHEVVWRMSAESTGIYFVRLTSSAAILTKKVLLLK
ncbi:MAG: T9SS type A sorting domain-containing protein [Fidelibacterota bacterium]